MCIDSKNEHRKDDLVVNGFIKKYSGKEKYLGHYLTDTNVFSNSIELDINERAGNVLVKLRNFINNHPNTSLEIRLKVFQACFCSAILSNCETWGQWIPRRVHTLYHTGLKLSLGVRTSTPTALIFLESRQPSVTALIRKRQLKFWMKLNKDAGTEMNKLILRAGETSYIQHYQKLEAKYDDPKSAFESINKELYTASWNEVRNASEEKTKIKLYHKIHNCSIVLPENSHSLKCQNQLQFYRSI